MYELLKKEIELIYNKIVDWRREIHQNPEVGFELDETCRFVYETLSSFGIEPIKCGKSGIVCYLGKTEGKCLMLRSDMDALKIIEKNDLKFKSKNDYMHACAHDIHTAMLLGCAYILKKYENKLNKRIKLMFQPAEEILEGARDMINNKVLDDVSSAIMLHVISLNNVDTGAVIIDKPNVIAPSSDFFEIIVSGKGAHGAMPEKGIDPIMIASHIVLGVNSLLTREFGLNDNVLITFGSFNSGDSNNVIPEEATLKGSIRCYDEDIRLLLKQRIKNISNDIARAFKGKAKVNYISGCPCLINNKKLREEVVMKFKDTDLNLITLINEEKSVGSEDFSYVSQEIPSLMIGVVSKGNIPLHNSEVIFDEEVLKVGTLIYSFLAFDNN